MGEFDESVRVALRDRAEGTVLVEQLLAGARRRGVWRRRLRHALLGGTVAAVAAAAAVVSVSVLGTRTGVEVVEPAGGTKPPRPPVAGPGESNVLRLDVADPFVNRLEWDSKGEKQSLHVGRARSVQGFSEYVVTRGRSAEDLEDRYPDYPDGGVRSVPVEQVRIGDDAGALNLGEGWAFVKWQRRDGAWLGVAIRFDQTAGDEASIRAAAIQAAQWVRADVAYRCVVDFRLTWTPPGSQPVGCVLGIAPGFRRYGQRFATGDKKSVSRLTPSR